MTLSAILELLPIFQSFFFVILFGFFLKRTFPNILMFFVMFSYFLVLLLGYISGYLKYEISIYSYYLMMPFLLAFMPFLYFYVLSLVERDFKFKPKLLLHFIPSILILIISSFLLFYSSKEELKGLIEHTIKYNQIKCYWISTYIKFYFIVMSYIYNIQSFTYNIIIIYIIYKHSKSIENEFSYKNKISLSWISNVVLAISIFSIINTIIFLLIYDIGSISTIITNVVAFLYISFMGYFASQQTLVYKEAEEKTTIFSAEIETISEENSSEKATNDISSSGLESIAKQLNILMESEKLYLNPELCLNDISEKTGYHKNIISKTISRNFQTNFFHWVNSYRIKEVERMFKDASYNKLSIEGLANSAGFNSKSVFNPEFKSFTGLTPSEYRKKFGENF